MMLFTNKKKIYYKDWIIEWLSEQKNYVKESTYANYSSIIFNHLIPELGGYYLNDINNKILQNLILKKYKNGRLDKNGGLSDKTIKDITILMKTSFKQATRTNLINNINLDFLYPKSSKKDKIFILSQNEQRKIMNYVITNKSPKNIDGSKGESKIIITTPKTKNANRDIPLNNEFAVILKSFKTNDEDYILSCSKKWIEPRTFRKYFDKMLYILNIDHINFHCLRHTFATNCIRLGTDYKTVSELLGHSSVNITLNLYVHPQMSQKKKCINLVCKDLQFNES